MSAHLGDASLDDVRLLSKFFSIQHRSRCPKSFLFLLYSNHQNFFITQFPYWSIHIPRTTPRERNSYAPHTSARATVGGKHSKILHGLMRTMLPTWRVPTRVVDADSQCWFSQSSKFGNITHSLRWKRQTRSFLGAKGRMTTTASRRVVIISARSTSNERSTLSPESAIESDVRSRWSNLWTDLSIDEAEAEMMREGRVSRAIETPWWRIMLLSDGSMTRHIKLATGLGDVRTDILWQGKVSLDDLPRGSVPDEVRDELLPVGASDVLFQREVDLCDSNGDPLVYACSWWPESAAERFIVDSAASANFSAREEPVGARFARTQIELHRRICRVYRGESSTLSSEWGVPGPFWARHYVFRRDGRPLCVIYEVLSPDLQRRLESPP